MNFEVIWSDFAESQLDEIFEYYVKNASLKVAKNLLQKLLAEPIRIMNSQDFDLLRGQSPSKSLSSLYN